MEFNITENQKTVARETARRRLETELFTAVLLAGVDPDSLELVNGSFSWRPNFSNAAYSDTAQLHLRDVLNVYEKFLSQT
jgi:hypothetical protein